MCPREVTHFEKQCPRDVIVHEMSPSLFLDSCKNLNCFQNLVNATNQNIKPKKNIYKRNSLCIIESFFVFQIHSTLDNLCLLEIASRRRSVKARFLSRYIWKCDSFMKQMLNLCYSISHHLDCPKQAKKIEEHSWSPSNFQHDFVSLMVSQKWFQLCPHF